MITDKMFSVSAGSFLAVPGCDAMAIVRITGRILQAWGGGWAVQASDGRRFRIETWPAGTRDATMTEVNMWATERN